ncbi:mitochondrial inner membrane protease subunit Imp2 [Penicillium herquei]|nr:mitochondrial inner membrane protease subunit Imp2 [Penicillium herquei]
MPPSKQPADLSNSRILNPRDAKRRARTAANSVAQSSEPQYASLLRKPSNAGPLTPRWHLPSIFNRFRQRYASLPHPVRRGLGVLQVFGAFLPIGLFFSEHVAQIVWVRGPSMTPYLNEDYDKTHTQMDMAVVSMWPWGWAFPWERSKQLERGMVVAIRSPAHPSNIAVKRVIGLPGDRITTREPCMRPSQIVPYNHVWLEGDAEDPRRTLDSNTYGPVSISLIQGRVVGILRPRMRWLNWQDWEAGQSGGATPDENENYRQSVRDRVVKEAVKLERPEF